MVAFECLPLLKQYNENDDIKKSCSTVENIGLCEDLGMYEEMNYDF